MVVNEILARILVQIRIISEPTKVLRLCWDIRVLFSGQTIEGFAGARYTP